MDMGADSYSSYERAHKKAIIHHDGANMLAYQINGATKLSHWKL